MSESPSIPCAYMLIVVASRNPVKVDAVRSAFSATFDGVTVESLSPPPGLRPQPMSLEETMDGAIARVAWACAGLPGADYCVGIESGVMELDDIWYAATVAAIRSGDGRSAIGIGPAYPLPGRISSLMLSEGIELEEAMDRLYGIADLGEREGAIGLLSKGMSSRLELCTEAVKMALPPFISSGDYRIM